MEEFGDEEGGRAMGISSSKRAGRVEGGPFAATVRRWRRFMMIAL